MVNRDIIISKMAQIQDSLDRLKQRQKVSLLEFTDERDIQDIVLFNMQIAIQGCVDIASHIISYHNWGVIPSLAGMFEVLHEKKVISEKTHQAMVSMAGFRNLIVHEYVKLDMKRVHQFLTMHLDDIPTFLKEIAAYIKL